MREYAEPSPYPLPSGWDRRVKRRTLTRGGERIVEKEHEQEHE